ncbi:MAG: DNA N-6-adenine-methyltransferase [Candidatus Pacebacteria bacterium]|nr:DNA N-6-adenine-methyltransferase [Candidatus Paceibacterota bacterium]
MLYSELDKEFHFVFDPCPIDWEHDTHPDGLSIDWKDSNFVNPPYSQTSKWIEKAYEESRKERLSVMLINACTDTKAFHEFVYKNPHAEYRFIKGRIKFTCPQRPECNQANMKASMIVIFHPVVVV